VVWLERKKREGGITMETLLIADHSGSFSGELKRRLEGEYRVLETRDGQEALELIRILRPGLLVLDLHLPGLDGLTLLHRCREENILPAVLATARFFSGYMIDVLVELGVGYLMLQPCDVDTAADRARELLRYRPGMGASRDNARRLLAWFSVPEHLSGSLYLCSAVQRMEARPMQFLTKELYPALSREFGVSAMAVERAMRHAVSRGFHLGDPRLWKAHFPGGKPENGEFIAHLAQLSRQMNRGGLREIREFPLNSREEIRISG